MKSHDSKCYFWKAETYTLHSLCQTTKCKRVLTMRSQPNRTNLRVHTAVPPHSSTFTQPEAAASSWVHVLFPFSARVAHCPLSGAGVLVLSCCCAPLRKRKPQEGIVYCFPRLPRSLQLTGRCDLLGWEEEEVDPWTEHCLAKGEQKPKLPCIFLH
ncbi:hypothetical protein Q9966_009969 [Columba livia]|nr:hypothetical protein Q9966_009969 [Columba livia]